MKGEAVLFLDSPEGRKQADRFEKRLKLKKDHIRIVTRKLEYVENRSAVVIKYEDDDEDDRS